MGEGERERDREREREIEREREREREKERERDEAISGFFLYIKLNHWPSMKERGGARTRKESPCKYEHVRSDPTTKGIPKQWDLNTISETLRYGGKHVIGLALLSATFLTILVPVVARWSVVGLIVLRFLTGFSQVTKHTKICPFLRFSQSISQINIK